MPWPCEHLVHERAIALGSALEKSTLSNYSSALTSYLTFVRIHNLPAEPTEDNLSFFVVYMSHHINPRSVATYLSGITQQLEPYYLNVRSARNSTLVQHTLQGCLKLLGSPVTRKPALSLTDLCHALQHYAPLAPHHDNLLFITMLLTGFFALLRLDEMTFPDNIAIREWRKVTRRGTLSISPSFTLPFHKADDAPMVRMDAETPTKAGVRPANRNEW